MLSIYTTESGTDSTLDGRNIFGQNMWSVILFRIKIAVTFIFRFHHCPTQIVVFFPVGLLSLSRHFQQVLLGVETEGTCVLSCRPFIIITAFSTDLVGCWSSFSTPNKTCWKCRDNDERPTRKNTTIWMGRKLNLKIKVTTILILNNICVSDRRNFDT